jgi:hypothetical protein
MVSFAEEMNARFRATMEDAHAVHDEFGSESTMFVGVYDGHGGRVVADFLRVHLHESVRKELEEKGTRSVEECLKASFLLTGASERASCTRPAVPPRPRAAPARPARTLTQSCPSAPRLCSSRPPLRTAASLPSPVPAPSPQTWSARDARASRHRAPQPWCA